MKGTWTWIFMVNDQLDAQFFSIYLFQFPTCFEQSRAHHQDNQLYQYNLWYMSLYDRFVCRSEITLKNKCCLYVIIHSRLFSVTICNLLIDFLIYFNSLHVSSNLVLFIRIINCIITTSGLRPAHEAITEWHIPDVVLIQWIILMMSTRLLETCRELK